MRQASWLSASCGGLVLKDFVFMQAPDNWQRSAAAEILRQQLRERDPPKLASNKRVSMSDDNTKQKRYDRQIRIWGAEGQQRLEKSRVALLNCSPTGSETLKNLVLGGIASFTIVDGEKVTPRDLGNNFLVLSSSVGSSRAQVVTELLKELNESVQGSYVEDTPAGLIENNPQFFNNFDLVIATQVRTTCAVSAHDAVLSNC